MLRSEIGNTVGPYFAEVTWAQIKQFCESTGSKHIEGKAPATMMTICRKGEFELLRKFGVQLKSVLHAEQEYTYDNTIVAGDVLKYETTLKSVSEKEGALGPMHFLFFETTVITQRETKKYKIGTTRTNILVRSWGKKP